jgi:hypothetical protein
MKHQFKYENPILLRIKLIIFGAIAGLITSAISYGYFRVLTQ